MADLKYVRKNRLRQEVEGRRRMILLLGLPSSLAGILSAPPLGWLGLLLVALLYLLVGRRDPARESGALGEDYSLRILSGLPDGYTVFNQVELPDERSRTGLRELDFIVCGPNGIFVVESKNHNGTLTGSEEDESWTVHKVGRGGTAYSSSVRNPVRQVRGQVAVLNKYLRSRKLNPWITGIVSLSSDNDTSGIKSRVPVVASAALSDLIRAFRGRREVGDLHKVVSAIAELVA